MTFLFTGLSRTSKTPFSMRDPSSRWMASIHSRYSEERSASVTDFGLRKARIFVAIWALFVGCSFAHALSAFTSTRAMYLSSRRPWLKSSTPALKYPLASISSPDITSSPNLVVSEDSISKLATPVVLGAWCFKARGELSWAWRVWMRWRRADLRRVGGCGDATVSISSKISVSSLVKGSGGMSSYSIWASLSPLCSS